MCYLNVQACKAKTEQHDKISKPNVLSDICDNDIIMEVLQAKKDALNSLKYLGMTVKLVVKDKKEQELLEMQDDHGKISINENNSTIMADPQEIYTEDECAEMLSEIDELKDAKVIDQLHKNYLKKFLFTDQVRNHSFVCEK